MMRWRLFVRLSVFLAGALGAWLFFGAPWEAAKKPDAQYLLNRVWVERAPANDRDQVLYFGVFGRSKLSGGFIARASTWRVNAERFRFTLKGKTLELELPQEDVRVSFEVRTWKCKGDAPKGYDLCLELRRDGQNLRLYGQEKSRLRGGPAAVEALADAPLEVPGCETCREALPALLLER